MFAYAFICSLEARIARREDMRRAPRSPRAGGAARVVLWVGGSGRVRVAEEKMKLGERLERRELNRWRWEFGVD